MHCSGASAKECHFGVTSCCLLKWRHFHEAFHSCDTYQISALIRGSSWSPKVLVVYSVGNEGFLFILFLYSNSFSFVIFPLSCPTVVLALFRSLFFFLFLHIVTYLCSLCLVWCQSPLQVWDNCMLCKLTMSFHSTQALHPNSLVFFPPPLPRLAYFYLVQYLSVFSFNY